MKFTFNGCSRSNMTISPKNWNTAKASMKKPWRIFYRFYDPAFRDNPKFEDGKPVSMRGMNYSKDREERQAITAELLANEKDRIDVQGYNPITGAFMAPAIEKVAGDVRPDTPFLEALMLTMEVVKVAPDTRADMRSILKYFGMSAQKLKKDMIPLKEVRRGDIILILDNCKNLMVEKVGKGKIVRKEKKIWTANQFNHYRKYLLILYGKLDLDQVVEYNPIEKIPLQYEETEEEKTARATLTDEEADKVNAFIREKDPAFYRLIHIFFHSGGRRTEIMRLKGKMVDLSGQHYKVLVKKRRKPTWVPKTIKDIALPFWKEAMEGCGPEDYVFSLNLVPGARKVLPQIVTRRWARYVKKALGIKADFYALKHKNTTDTTTAMMAFLKRKEAAQALAAEQNSHTTSAMVVGIYDTKEAARMHEELKTVKNSFGTK